MRVVSLVAMVATMALVLTPTNGVDVCVKHLYKPDNSAYFDVSSLAAPESSPYRLSEVVHEADDTVYEYVFNLCAPVSCGSKGDGFGGCQNYTDSYTHYRGLGTSASVSFETLVSDDREGFTATYTDGTMCNGVTVDGKQVARSMKISAICTPGATTPTPAFIGETGYCEYDFEIYAESACPIPVGPPDTPAPCHEDNKLIVTQETGGIQFYYPVWELEKSIANPLALQTSILGAEFAFELNVCARVSCPDSSIASGKDVSGCAHPSGKPMFSLGTLDSVSIAPYAAGDVVDNTPVDVLDGFVATYSGGDPCDPAMPSVGSTLTLNAVCDSLMRDIDPPRVVFTGQSTSCGFSFAVYSHLACPHALHPETIPVSAYGDCPVQISTGTGFYYDLAPMIQDVSSPFIVEDARFNVDRQHRFNLCAPSQCSYTDCGDDECYKVEVSDVPTENQASCVFWSEPSGIVHGLVSGDLTRTHAVHARPDLSGFTVEYINGDECPTDEEHGVPLSLRGRRTVIHAVCDPSATGMPQTSLLSESHAPCTTSIELRSELACPKREKPAVATTCAQAYLFSNTAGEAYNFHQADTTYTVTSQLDGVSHEYTFSLCTPVPCPGAAQGVGDATVCHKETPAGASEPTLVEVLGQRSTTDFLAHAADDGYTVFYKAPAGVEDSAGLSVHVMCDSSVTTPEASFMGVSAHGVIELMVKASVGACREAYIPPAHATSSGAAHTVGSKGSGAKSFTIVFVLVVVFGTVFCFALVGLKMYKNAHPESSLPDPTSPCSTFMPCDSSGPSVVDRMMQPVGAESIPDRDIVNINDSFGGGSVGSSFDDDDGARIGGSMSSDV